MFRWFKDSLGIGSIRKKMIVYFAILFVLSTIVISTITQSIFFSTLERKNISDTKKIMGQTIHNVDLYFKDIQSPMVMIARNPNVLKALKSYTEEDWIQRVDIKRKLDDFTNNIDLFKPYIKDIIIIGKNGFRFNINPVDQVSIDYDFDHSSWLEEFHQKDLQGIQYITTHDSDYYFGSLSKEQVVSAVMKVSDNKTELGYIIVDIDLKEINKIFNSLSFGEEGVIYMIDKNGQVIFHPNISKVQNHVDSNLSKKIEKEGSTSGSFIYKNNNRTDLVVFSKSKVTDWTIIRSIPYSTIVKSASKVKDVTNLILLISVIFIIIISSGISFQITKPLKRLVNRISSVTTHDFRKLDVNYGEGEVAVIGHRFEEMVGEIDRLINEVYITKLKQKETELKVLQNQINPHFLYNSLQLIKAEAILGNPRGVSSIVTALGELFRYPMYTQDEWVRMEEELNHVTNYLSIFQRRFKGKLEFMIHCDNNLLDIKTPKLLLQPIVENCILHGFENLKESGTIIIKVQAVEKGVQITIRDNGIGMSEKQLMELNRKLVKKVSEQSIGLSNINQRLMLTFGEESGLTIKSVLGKGTNVEFQIPISEN